MRKVYARTRVLLAPSQWEEAWGRVATEAHFSGIPVLGSRQGGLPEAIGPGGVTLPADAPTADWVAALRRMWDDAGHYETLSRAAVDWSERDQIDADHQIATLEKVLADTIAAAGPRAAA